MNTKLLAILQCIRHIIDRFIPWTHQVSSIMVVIISAVTLSPRLLPTAPPRPTAARPSCDHPCLMLERRDRLRVGIPISAPRTELKGASESAERRRASRVRRRACGECLAVYEYEFEVLAARSLHPLRVRVVPVCECLQECAGCRRRRRVGGTGGARRGGLCGDQRTVEG